MLTLANIRKSIKAFYGVGKITVTVGYEHMEDGTTEYDVNVNVWGYDKWFNSEFDSFTRNTFVDNEAKALKEAERVFQNLASIYCDKVTFEGLENC